MVSPHWHTKHACSYPRQECCKPYHKGEPAPTVEATVRARFSAVIKRELLYLLSTFHPEFHAYQYGTEPGGAQDKLREDMERTLENFVYSNLRILRVSPARQLYL